MARFQRDRSKERFWRRVVRQWRRSGGSIRAFCAERGLSEPSFYAWRRRLAELDQAAVTSKQATRRMASKRPNQEDNGSVGAFVPVQVVGSAASEAATMATSAIEVVVGAGRVVRIAAGFDTATLQRLLALLEGRPC